MNAAPQNPTDQNSTDWNFVHRPRRLRTIVISLAALIMVIHIVWAFILVRGDTGVGLGVGEQLSFVIIGLIFAGVLLLLLRIRVRVGAPGVELRGPMRTRLWDWSDVVGVTFPRSSKWPRLELPAYEHSGIWAIQTNDGQEAVEAMGRLRDVIRDHKPSAADPETVADR